MNKTELGENYQFPSTHVQQNEVTDASNGNFLIASANTFAHDGTDHKPFIMRLRSATGYISVRAHLQDFDIANRSTITTRASCCCRLSEREHDRRIFAARDRLSKKTEA